MTRPGTPSDRCAGGVWNQLTANWRGLEEQTTRRELPDPEYADVDEAGQLALGLAGEQRAIPGLAPTRKED